MCLSSSAQAVDAVAGPPVAKAAKAAGKKTSPGVEVSVTAEVTGAGLVSSGVALPPIPPLTGDRKNPVPSWGKPLPYPILVADRRNNRLIEVAPDKRIIREFPSPNLKVYRGSEDVNFSPDGRLPAVSEEDNFDVHIVDYEKRDRVVVIDRQTKAIIWQYGVTGKKGYAPGYLNYPDGFDIDVFRDWKNALATKWMPERFVQKSRLAVLRPGR